MVTYAKQDAWKVRLDCSITPEPEFGQISTGCTYAPLFISEIPKIPINAVTRTERRNLDNIVERVCEGIRVDRNATLIGWVLNHINRINFPKTP